MVSEKEMGNKEGMDSHIEDLLRSHRRFRERREATEYDVRLSYEGATHLRDALIQRREDTMLLIPGAFSNSGMLATPSNVENKLHLAVALQDDVVEPPVEILVHLQASDLDELNTSLFPTITTDERSMVTLEHLFAVNKAYTMAGGIERPRFAEAVKPYQV